ncbi:MAG: DUF1501 domain-containing protein, partial [Pseudomonadota bacterium]|nr:DUF1501 domain-containing protein [Pseudomonadota bacterium]
HMQRRNFLKAGFGLGGAVAIGGGATMSAFTTPTMASSEDYKAIVYLYIHGGNDGWNMITPMDTAGYAQYKKLRADIALPQGSLIPLSAEFAMHGELAPLKAAWDEGAMGVVHNVGILARPLTKAQLYNPPGPGYVPDGIASHVAGSALWQTGGSDASWMNHGGASVAPPGWGAGALDQLGSSGVWGGGLFGNGRNRSSEYPASPNAYGFQGFTGSDNIWSDKGASMRYQKFQKLIQAHRGANTMEGAYAAMQDQVVDLTARLNPVFMQNAGDPAALEISAAFNNLTDLGAWGALSYQMFQIAKLIKNRAIVGGNRHVFLCTLPFGDTHWAQLDQQGAGLHGVGKAMGSFYQAMKALGLSNNVTALTGSDFGRTYSSNGGGTDHAWGNEHIVVGGAVKTKFTGKYPLLELGGIDDADSGDGSRGRWIPTTSVDQYVGTVLKWFDSRIDLTKLLPHLSNFPNPDLGFMRT